MPDKTLIHALSGDSLFKAVFEKIQTGIIIVDSEMHTIVDANPLAEEILGYPKDKLVGKRCHDFICPAKPGSCPITDLHTSIDNAEREMITSNGNKITILKTVASVSIHGKNYLIESFTDLTDRKRADDQKVILIGYLSESIHRVRRPLQLTSMNLQIIADQVKTGEFDPEEIRMELQIQKNNIEKMIKTLEELTESVTKDQPDISPEFRKFFAGK